jgi:hypothetical protein
MFNSFGAQCYTEMLHVIDHPQIDFGIKRKIASKVFPLTNILPTQVKQGLKNRGLYMGEDITLNVERTQKTLE